MFADWLDTSVESINFILQQWRNDMHSTESVSSDLKINPSLEKFQQNFVKANSTLEQNLGEKHIVIGKGLWRYSNQLFNSQWTCKFLVQIF